MRIPTLDVRESGVPTSPFYVNIPARYSSTGRRERRFFPTQQKAQAYANLEKSRWQNEGIGYNSSAKLTPPQRDAAAAAFRLLGDEYKPEKLIAIQYDA